MTPTVGQRLEAAQRALLMVEATLVALANNPDDLSDPREYLEPAHRAVRAALDELSWIGKHDTGVLESPAPDNDQRDALS